MGTQQGTAIVCKKMVVGYAPGAYDLFHVGHLNLLRKAKQQCDYLIAGVVSDEMLFKQKGIQPVIPLQERLEIVRNIRFVDEAVAEILPDKVQTWEHLRFDVLFKGDDWKGTEMAIQLEKAFAERDVKVVYFPYTLSTSSSLLRKTLARLNGVPGKAKIPFYKAATLLFLKPRFQKALRPLTGRLAKAGVTANEVTVVALLGSILISMLFLGFLHHSAIFGLLPLWLLLRMGLSTIDGLLAIEHGQKSRLGGILNEGGDILSDFLLALPFAVASRSNQSLIFALMGLSIVSECIGMTGPWLGGDRCNYGPFGKTDRAIAFSLVSVWLAVNGSLPLAMHEILLVFIGLHIITLFNRTQYLLSLMRK
jgi:glycerol-3-phosphate cytidylyltransferase